MLIRRWRHLATFRTANKHFRSERALTERHICSVQRMVCVAVCWRTCRMSQQDGYSPSFKRPADILRLRRRRTRSDAGASCDPRGSSSSPAARTFSPGRLFTSGGSKRRNPFAFPHGPNCPNKKLVISQDACEGQESDSPGRGRQGEGAVSVRLPQEHKRCVLFSETGLQCEEEQEDIISPLLKSPSAAGPAPAAPLYVEYPADWSLKTRVLFTSPLSLSWAEQPKAQEEAQGLSQHCRAEFNPLPDSLQDPRSCSELRCAFQQSLVYWQHPSLPWLSLFPRINAERSFSGKSTPWAQDTALQQSLMRDWSISLSSLYSLLKSRLCPYFYLCSCQFTALFRTAGLGGCSNITALISPTTRGLREALKAEGIEFSLPLLVEKRKSREKENLAVYQEEEHKEQKELCSELKEAADFQASDEEDLGGCSGDEDGSFSWLKEMGVQDKIKKPDSLTIQLCKEDHTVSLDHKPESVICVEGPHTFTLINFFINWKSVVAAAGSQAGLPPTLLAPSAFRGATMNTLKGRSVNVKNLVGSSYQNISSLEITGPVLPSSLHAITTLLRPAQKGDFTAALYTHAPTAVMNVNITKQQVNERSVDLSPCGLHPASIQQLQQSSSLGKTALTYITMDNYSYTWKN